MKQFSLVFTLIDNFELEPKFKALYFIFTTIVYLNLTLAVVKQLFSLQILIPPFMFKTVLLEKNQNSKFVLVGISQFSY